MKILFIISTMIFSSCSLLPRDNDKKDSRAKNLAELENKYLNYRIMVEQVLDEDGWIATDECDSLLHTSLLASAKGANYENLFAARDADGRWYRRPSKDCLSSGEAKSSISRDMILGLLVPVAYFKLEKTAKKLLDYADEHNRIMGESDGSIDGINRIILTPSLYSLIEDVYSYTKNSLDAKPARPEEDPFEDEMNLVDFTDHLDALAIEVKGTIYGAINSYEIKILDKLRKEDPNNALFHALYNKYKNGDQNEAVDILLREDIFPSDRLPESKDRCIEYLFMHGEKDKDWKPCKKEKRVHPGHDLMFVSRIILGGNL